MQQLDRHIKESLTHTANRVEVPAAVFTAARAAVVAPSVKPARPRTHRLWHLVAVAAAAVCALGFATPFVKAVVPGLRVKIEAADQGQFGSYGNIDLGTPAPEKQVTTLSEASDWLGRPITLPMGRTEAVLNLWSRYNKIENILVEKGMWAKFHLDGEPIAPEGTGYLISADAAAKHGPDVTVSALVRPVDDAEISFRSGPGYKVTETQVAVHGAPAKLIMMSGNAGAEEQYLIWSIEGVTYVVNQGGGTPLVATDKLIAFAESFK